MTGLRIGIVCPYSFDEPGGVQAHILDLATYLRRHGHHVEVLGPASKSTELPSWVHKGGGSVAVPYNGSVARLSIGPKVRRHVADFIERGNFDVLHIHEPNSPSFSLAALRMADGPIVATFHTSGDESWLLQWARPWLMPLLEKIRAGIAVSEMARRFQVNQLGGDPVVIPNGVDVGFYANHRRDDAEAADSGEQGSRALNRPIKLAFLGRLDEPRKGFQVLWKALDELTIDWELTVMGKGEQTPREGVTYLGRVSDEEKADVLSSHDIYIAPNTGGESFGIVLVEAMAAGSCVLASDLEAFRLVLQSDIETPAGEIFPTGDASALAAAITKLADDAELRTTYARRGQARCQDFDWSVVASDIVRVYEMVATGEKVHL